MPRAKKTCFEHSKVSSDGSQSTSAIEHVFTSWINSQVVAPMCIQVQEIGNDLNPFENPFRKFEELL